MALEDTDLTFVSSANSPDEETIIASVDFNLDTVTSFNDDGKTDIFIKSVEHTNNNLSNQLY
jgi:hypothetical protein